MKNGTGKHSSQDVVFSSVAVRCQPPDRAREDHAYAHGNLDDPRPQRRLASAFNTYLLHEERHEREGTGKSSNGETLRKPDNGQVVFPGDRTLGWLLHHGGDTENYPYQKSGPRRLSYHEKTIDLHMTYVDAEVGHATIASAFT